MEQKTTTIKMLDSATISRIAAGEVVERPASVIKELLENAIDARSTAITVEIRGAGIDYIRVTDNGAGIDKGQIRLAFERHATSKLQSGADLLRIENLGFRGEALNAIAQVSRVEMKSRPSGQEHGMRIVNEGGNIADIGEAGSPDGTSIIVRDLFFNTPVRRKFLKKPAQETAACSDIVMREMLAHPEISFRYIVDKKQIYRTPGDGKLRTVLFCLYGREFAAQMTPVEGERGGLRVEGFVGYGPLARGNRKEQSFFINGRYIRSVLLSRALEQACSMRVMIQKFPVCALQITMPYDLVDVNVHPNKLDVRFRDEALIFQYLVEIIEASLALEEEQKHAPERPAEKSRSAAVNAFSGTGEALRSVFDALAPREGIAEAVTPVVTAMEISDIFPAEVEAEETAPVQDIAPPHVTESHVQASLQETFFNDRVVLDDAKVIGRAFSTYIILEKDESLLFVDQHAAHERLLYDRFQKLYGAPSAQYLLAPEVVELSHGELLRLGVHGELLRNAGFVYEEFGERSIRILAVPHFLGFPNMRLQFRDLLDQLGEHAQAPEAGRDRLISHACRMAIKAGDVLSDQDVLALLREIERTGIRNCPHGRPIYAALSKRELEKKFGRIV